MATTKKTTPKATEVDEKVSISSPIARDLKSQVGEVKKKAFFKRVVTITYNDKRDSDVVTTAYLTCENQFFSLSRIVPIGISVELEQCLIDTAQEATILTHVPEIKGGKRTGNMVPKMVKKYNINYDMKNK